MNRRNRNGVRRAEPSRYPLSGLVVCDCCGKKLQGNLVRGHAFYRCKVSSDYPVAVTTLGAWRCAKTCGMQA